MAAQSMPPAAPANKASENSQKPPLVSSSKYSTTAPAAMAPTTNCPSAPILNTLARKHMARPTEIISNGASLTPTSDQPRRSLSGSRKNMARLAKGSFPTARNRKKPHAMVSSTASTGENHDIQAEGCARGSSLNMGGLRSHSTTRPQAAHPLPDEIEVG